MENNSLIHRQGRHGGLHVSRLRARHDAPPTVKPNLRHFQSSEIKNKDRTNKQKTGGVLTTPPPSTGIELSY